MTRTPRPPTTHRSPDETVVIDPNRTLVSDAALSSARFVSSTPPAMPP
jgi:hypothetical protein